MFLRNISEWKENAGDCLDGYCSSLRQDITVELNILTLAVFYSNVRDTKPVQLWKCQNIDFSPDPAFRFLYSFTCFTP